MQGKCNSCNWIGNFIGYQSRELDNDVTEIGIECPGCEKWYHSHYLTSELEKLQEKVKSSKGNRKTRREYERKFRKVQDKLRKEYGTEEPKFADNQATS